jgi:hypothetical protein
MNLTGYARAIERLWSRRQERAVVLSPREWKLVGDWYDRGIPLRLVEEAIETSRIRRPRGGLGHVAAAVEEAWEVIVQGRLGEVKAGCRRPAAEEAEERLSAWHRRRESSAAGSPLRRLLDDLLERQAGGAEPAELDRRVDAALPEAAPREWRRRARDEVERALEPYRETMRPDVLETTRCRATLERLRQLLGLPRLSGASDQVDERG